MSSPTAILSPTGSIKPPDWQPCTFPLSLFSSPFPFPHLHSPPPHHHQARKLTPLCVQSRSNPTAPNSPA
jgi:hypothetical protein